MLFPLVVAFVAVFLGGWLALGPREGARSVGPIRLVAIVAAVLVIAGHLLPEAFHELGLQALFGFVLGLGIPMLTERLSAMFSRPAPGKKPGTAEAGLEIAYAGLVVHRFGDGLSMGAYSRTEHGAWAQAGVVLALAAHIIPVTTVMVLALAAVYGRRMAAFRAFLLAVSTMTGVVVASLAVAGHSSDISPWISAVVAGLLLHIVVHGRARPGRTSAPSHSRPA